MTTWIFFKFDAAARSTYPGWAGFEVDVMDSNFWRRLLCCSILTVPNQGNRANKTNRVLLNLKKRCFWRAVCIWIEMLAETFAGASQISSWEWGSARLGYILVWSMLNRKYRRRSQSLFLFPTDLGRSKRLCSQGIPIQFGTAIFIPLWKSRKYLFPHFLWVMLRILVMDEMSLEVWDSPWACCMQMVLDIFIFSSKSNMILLFFTRSKFN